MAWEAISGNTTFATFMGTEVGFVTVSMHGVGFTLMAEEARRGRETRVLTGNNLAPVWLQMGVDKFAGRRHYQHCGWGEVELKRTILIITLKLLWLVLTAVLALPWTVVKSIGLWGAILVQWMIPGSVVYLNTRATYQP